MSTQDHKASDRESRLDAILGAYFEALEAGQTLDPSEWVERHPDFAIELADFFAVQERLHRLTSPLREPAALAAKSGPDGLMRPQGAEPSATIPDQTSPSRIRYFGDYELIEMIDRGGMGVVYRARQRSLDRLVAVKIIAPGHHLSDTALARFRNEARVVANLDHPGIVPIYEVGLHLGVSYFSMKLMEGGSLADRLAGFGAGPRTAARLVATVARAVDHAHKRGVLHRDLKPSNLLLDADGAVYVGDFGLARRFVEGPGGDPSLTLTGELLGSPSYMAPEQAEGRREEVTIATDVHGLGAVLYALLAGRPPYRADSVASTLEAVRRLEPEPPQRLNPAVPPDLQAICLKCLEKNPVRRYSTALGVAEDLERFLAGKPTHARPPGLPARLRHWAGRHRRRLAIGAAGLLLCGLSVLVGLLLHRLERMRQVATSHAQDLVLRDRQGRHAHYVEQIRHAAQFARSGAARACEDVLAGLRPANSGDDDPRGFEWYYLWGLLQQEQRSWTAHGGRDVYQVVFSRDGRTLATCGADGTARLWDAATLAPRAVLRGHEGDVNAVDFAPDGRTLATVGDDATLRFWHADGSPLGAPLPALGTPVPKLDEPWALAVRFDHAGRRVYSGGADQKVRIWDPDTHQQVGMLEFPSRVGAFELSPDDALIGIATSNPGLYVYELNAPGGPRFVEPADRGPWADATTSVVFSADGRTLAATNDRTIELWDVATRHHLATLSGHLVPIYCMAFAPEGRTLASCDATGTIRLWNIDRPDTVRILLGHRDRIWGCAFSPDGRTLATGSRDGTVKLWDAQARPDRIEFPSLPYHTSVAFRDADTLVTASMPGEVRTYRLPDRKLLGVEPQVVTNAPAYLCGTRLAQQGAAVAVTASPDGVRLRRLSGEPGIATLPGESECYLTPDGSLLVTRGADGRAVLRETGSLRRRGVFGSPKEHPAGVAPDGAVLIGEPDGQGGSTLIRYDPGTGQQVATRNPAGRLMVLHWSAFSPDGRFLAIPAEDASVHLFDGRTLARLAVLPGHAAKFSALAFSPDGRTLATGGGDGTVRLWHVASGQLVLSFEGLSVQVFHLAFSPDSRSLAAACTRPVVWRAGAGPPTLRPVAPTP